MKHYFYIPLCIHLHGKLRKEVPDSTFLNTFMYFSQNGNNRKKNVSLEFSGGTRIMFFVDRSGWVALRESVACFSIIHLVLVTAWFFVICKIYVFRSVKRRNTLRKVILNEKENNFCICVTSFLFINIYVKILSWRNYLLFLR